MHKLKKMAAMTALAAAAATTLMAAPAAHAATISAGRATATKYTHTATTQTVHNNPTYGPLVYNNACNTSANAGLGWNIGACGYFGLTDSWGDGYINSHGYYTPPGCHIELITYQAWWNPLGTEFTGPQLSASYPCSTYGHIGPLHLSNGVLSIGPLPEPQVYTVVEVLDGQNNWVAGVGFP